MFFEVFNDLRLNLDFFSFHFILSSAFFQVVKFPKKSNLKNLDLQKIEQKEIKDKDSAQASLAQ